MATRLSIPLPARRTAMIVISRPPLVLFHGEDASVDAYQPLARRLGPRQSCVNAQPKDATLGLAEAATRHAEELRAANPGGPHRLGGWSDGGLLAFHTARELVRRGEEVDLVVVI